MKKLFFIFFLLSSPFVFAGEYKVDAVHSSVKFRLRHFFSQFTGDFKKFEGTVHFSAKDLTKTTLSAKVYVDSVETRNAKRDKHLRSADYFDVAKHALMTFESKKVVSVKGKNMKIRGDLTIRGVTKSVVMNVRFLGQGKDNYKKTRAGFQATTVINRTAFGVGKKSVALGSKVTITLDIAAVK